MATYYLDIETFGGFNPEFAKIITVQYQELERASGIPKGDLVILKEWELGEAEVIKRLIENTCAASSKDFAFVPVGYNLKFEHKFLSYRSKMYNLPIIDIGSKPMIDLHPAAVIMNNCKFLGSGLDRMTGKAQSGSQIAEWYQDKNYNQIINYIEDETREFLKFFGWMCKEMPALHKRFMMYIS